MPARLPHAVRSDEASRFQDTNWLPSLETRTGGRNARLDAGRQRRQPFGGPAVPRWTEDTRQVYTNLCVSLPIRTEVSRSFGPVPSCKTGGPHQSSRAFSCRFRKVMTCCVMQIMRRLRIRPQWSGQDGLHACLTGAALRRHSGGANASSLALESYRQLDQGGC
jgi:hypothetical protein